MKIAYLFAGVVGVTLAAAAEKAAKPASGPSPEDIAKAQVTPTQVAGSVWMIQGLGGNIGASGGADGLFVVDSQYAALAPKIREALDKVSAHPARFLLDTHWHPDHTGGNVWLAEAGATILAHDNVRKRLSTAQDLPMLGAKAPAAPQKAWPIITFDDELELHLNGDDIRVVYLPAAHTDGDVAVHFAHADVIHTGDVFLNGNFPIIDYGSGGTPDGLLRAQEKLLAMAGPKTKIIPGHGPLADKAALQDAHDTLQKLRDRMVALIDQGKSLADLKAAKPTAEVDAKWGKGFLKPDAFVEMFFNAYAAQRAAKK